MNDKVTFSLTSVKGHMGRDSYSFTANLNVNGKIVANVNNDGNGSCNTFYWNTAADRDKYVPLLEEYARENAMGWMLENLDGEYAELEDWAIEILLNNRDYTRDSKTKIVLRKAAADEEVYTVLVKAPLTREVILKELRELHIDLRVFDVAAQGWVA